MAELTRIAWWQWLPLRPWRIVARVEAADEVPAQLPRNGAVLVGSLKYPKWLVFDCPCDGGHRIMVTLDTNHFPHWRIVNPQRLTVWPSVDFDTAGRRCHFLVKNGRIIWVPKEGWSI